MVRIEILFKNGHVIAVSFDQTQEALHFIKEVKAVDTSSHNLWHISNSSEEILIHLADISYIRLLKDADFRTQREQEDKQQEAVLRKNFENLAIEDEIEAMKKRTH